MTLSSGNIDDLITVLDTNRNCAESLIAEFIQNWLDRVPFRHCREIGIAKFQDLWGHVKPLFALSHIAQITQGQQEPTCRGAIQVDDGGNVTKRCAIGDSAQGFQCIQPAGKGTNMRSIAFILDIIWCHQKNSPEELLGA